MLRLRRYSNARSFAALRMTKHNFLSPVVASGARTGTQGVSVGDGPIALIALISAGILPRYLVAALHRANGQIRPVQLYPVAALFRDDVLAYVGE
jgi:hypothetical protein